MTGDAGDNDDNSYLNYLITGLVLAASIMAVMMHVDPLPNASGANKIQTVNYEGSALPMAN